MRLSSQPVRLLTATDLGLVKAERPEEHDEQKPLARIGDAELDDDDEHLKATVDLLDTFGGVIFVGPPGTSKSWYAGNIAVKLTKGDPDLVRFVQFHPSYQYEDFVEGYVPNDAGGFDLRPKHLLELCTLARERGPGEWVVLVIDELTRGDPGRIFGEALTYVEKTKRGLEFHLASGTQISIPNNLVFLATMNPLDRGVDEVDAAFERRFAKIAMDPDAELLEELLVQAGMDEPLRNRVRRFFEAVNGRARSTPSAALGHTFFDGVGDQDGLRRLWNHQLRFLFAKAYQLDPDGLAEVTRLWERIFESPEEPGATEGSNEVVEVGTPAPEEPPSNESP